MHLYLRVLENYLNDMYYYHQSICHLMKWARDLQAFGIAVRILSNQYFIFAVTNKKPALVSITKVKQFEGTTSFVRRSQWMLEQLRQVNGIDPNRVSREKQY